MEAGPSPDRVAINFEFAVLKTEEDVPPRDFERELVYEARRQLVELESDLRREVAYSDFPIEIQQVRLRQGSVIVEVIVILYGGLRILDLYGGSRDGFNRLLRDLNRVCERFLRGHFGRLKLGPQIVSWAPAVAATPAQPPKAAREILLWYLAISNAILFAALLGILVVLLTRTG